MLAYPLVLPAAYRPRVVVSGGTAVVRARRRVILDQAAGHGGVGTRGARGVSSTAATAAPGVVAAAGLAIGVTVGGVIGRGVVALGCVLRGLLHQGLGLATGPVLVVGVLGHVEGAQPFGLVDEGPLVGLAEELPLGTQAFADLGVVHFRVLLGHFSALPPGPHHEGVHRALHAIYLEGERGKTRES